MNTIDSLESGLRRKTDVSADLIRQSLLKHSKNFKTSWVNLGQALYSVWKDKLYHAWGYEKFEHYTEKELGIKKPTAIKLLKTYFFVEQDEPAYLSDEFREKREAAHVPGCDAVNVLRLARRKKELTSDDYTHLKKSAFESGRDATVLRKELTALIKQRKDVDPDEERQKRNEVAIRRLVNAVRSFQKDMEALKLVPADVLQEADRFVKRLEIEVNKKKG